MGKSKVKVSPIFIPKGTYFITSSEGMKEYEEKKDKRNYNNLPFSAYNSSTWCQFFANIYNKIYGKRYENYYISKKLESEAIIISNFVYPYAFDELKYSAREFAKFLTTYLQTSHNANRDLAITMLSKPASFSKMNYYIKKYRRIRKDDPIESIIYVPHTPLTNDPDDLQLILESTNLTPIQMLANYGISIFHKYLQLKGPFSYEEATKRTNKIIMNEILIKYRNEPELIRELFRIITKNTILWEPSFKEGHLNGVKTSSYYSLDWRNEFGNFWKEFSFYKEDWWKSESQTEKLQPIVAVHRFFSVQPK